MRSRAAPARRAAPAPLQERRATHDRRRDIENGLSRLHRVRAVHRNELPRRRPHVRDQRRVRHVAEVEHPGHAVLVGGVHQYVEGIQVVVHDLMPQVRQLRFDTGSKALEQFVSGCWYGSGAAPRGGAACVPCGARPRRWCAPLPGVRSRATEGQSRSNPATGGLWRCDRGPYEGVPGRYVSNRAVARHPHRRNERECRRAVAQYARTRQCGNRSSRYGGVPRSESRSRWALGRVRDLEDVIRAVSRW